MFEFTHPGLNTEITAIGGHYVFVKENCLTYEADQILYHVGYAVIDSSCCGTGGAAYASVAGYVRQWHFKTAEDGRPVSQLEPVSSPAAQNKISRIIQAKESVPQINFVCA